MQRRKCGPVSPAFGTALVLSAALIVIGCSSNAQVNEPPPSRTATALLGVPGARTSRDVYDRLATLEAGRFFRVMVGPECAASLAQFPILAPTDEAFRLRLTRSTLEGPSEASALTYSAFFEVIRSGHELKVMQGYDTRVDVPADATAEMVGGHETYVWLDDDVWYAYLDAGSGRSLSVRTSNANEEELVQLVESLAPVNPSTREECTL